MSESADPSLPAPLASAVKDFRAWMQDELLADQARTTPRSPLYHYTREASLHGVLEHRKIWCFSHSQQSDDTEVIYSLEIARQVVREEARRREPSAKSLLTGLDGILGTNLMREVFDFYFFSLSRHRDHGKQWAEYGDCGKGFAIGFSPALFQPDRSDLMPLPNENVFVGQIIYGRDATRTRHRRGIQKLAEIVTRMAETNLPLVRKNKQAWFDNLNQEYIAELLIWNCLTAKAGRYRREQETRYILMGMREIFDCCRKQHGERNYVETLLPLQEKGNITEIIVGPNAPSGAETMVQNLLRSLGYPDDIPVSRSAVSAM